MFGSKEELEVDDLVIRIASYGVSVSSNIRNRCLPRSFGKAAAEKASQELREIADWLDEQFPK